MDKVVATRQSAIHSLPSNNCCTVPEPQPDPSFLRRQQANASLSVPVESRREVVKGAELFVLTTHGKMGIYSKANTKNETVDVLVNER